MELLKGSPIVLLLTFVKMALAQNGESAMCERNCPPGSHLVKRCEPTDPQSILCSPCESETFMDVWNRDLGCISCRSCTKKNEQVKKNCTFTHNTVCECNAGFYLKGESFSFCSPHLLCGYGYGVSELGTAVSDVKCTECVDGETFSDHFSSTDGCVVLTKCEEHGLVLVQQGTTTKNNVCANATKQGGLINDPTTPTPENLTSIIIDTTKLQNPQAPTSSMPRVITDDTTAVSTVPNQIEKTDSALHSNSQIEGAGVSAEKALKSNRIFFIEHLEVDGVVAYLQDKEVFTNHHAEKIKLPNKTTLEQVTTFLDILQRLGPDAVEFFYEALIYTKQFRIADKLKPEKAPSKPFSLAPLDPAEALQENGKDDSACCASESQSTQRFGTLSQNPSRTAFFQFLAQVFAGTDWKQSLRLFPGLELTDQDLELVEMDYNKYNTMEVVYQAVRKWHDINGDKVPFVELKKCLVNILISKCKLEASEAIIKIQQVEAVLDYGVETDTRS